MTKRGRICEVTGSRLRVVPEKNMACFGCINQECRKGAGLMDAENPLALPLEAGQMVEMQVPAFFVLGQALAALLPPALGFGAGFGAARFLLPAAGEGTHTGIGAAALFAAAFGVYRLRKNNPPKRGYAVTCVIDPVEGPPENSNARANGTEPMVVNPGR